MYLVSADWDQHFTSFSMDETSMVKCHQNAYPAGFELMTC